MPRSVRLHIGIYGKRNSGKSSLINALSNQSLSIVSDVPGTTTDPVYKSMEIHGIGPVVLIDSPGIDDEGDLGKLRVDKTNQAIDKTDLGIILFSSGDLSYEISLVDTFARKGIPYVCVAGKVDIEGNVDRIARDIEGFKHNSPMYDGNEKLLENINASLISFSAKTGEGLDKIKELLIRNVPKDYEMDSITAHLVNEDDIVLLVMPQDIQAPKGRLILPQVQTIRDLLDNKCVIMSVTTDKLDKALKTLKEPPSLIITDSQVFDIVYSKKPEGSRLTSFSVLFARYKGDIEYFKESAGVIGKLNNDSKVLIAEACTHAPLTEDIGREKIPTMLRHIAGNELTIDMVSGSDFPKDISSYDLIIHCGACMFNRRYVLNRVEMAKEAHVPMTNYGITIAYIKNILDKIDD